ncbi:MAG: hypothetical protein VYA78_01935, partial [Chloroflexota bacterium]|nr:hypothetical protein [Chloroflexota bacterium]
MASASELFKAWKEGFDNKDSSQVAGFLTDDFEYSGVHYGSKTKQETLDWIGSGGYPTAIDNMELLYENDEVAVLMHSAEGNLGKGIVMAFATK